jgi:hypothetical protein
LLCLSAVSSSQVPSSLASGYDWLTKGGIYNTGGNPATLTVGQTAYGIGGSVTVVAGNGSSSGTPGNIILTLPNVPSSGLIKFGTNASINYSGNFITSGNITASNFIGNGSGLTNINAANVTGNFNTINAGSNNITTTGTISGNAANIKGLLTVYGVAAFNIITSDNTSNAISFYKKEATSIWDYPNRSGWIGFSGNDIVLQNEAGGNTYIGGTKVVLSGNATIGTNTVRTGCALTVNGKIAAEEFEIVTDVALPDYVFGKSYKLRPLKDLENYINANSHLPETPSANEIEKNGYKVVEMDNLLLKKVEELTLYTIALNKKLEATEAELAKVKEGK